MTGKLLQIFPRESRDFWRRTTEAEKEVQEIRLRADAPILIIKSGKEWYLDHSGNFTDRQKEARTVSTEEMEKLLQHICHYSLYAFEDELKQGFLTVSGGHRVGIAGQVVLEGNGSVRTIKHISYMNIRISHEIRGAADGILPGMYEAGKLKNILILEWNVIKIKILLEQ